MAPGPARPRRAPGLQHRHELRHMRILCTESEFQALDERLVLRVVAVEDDLLHALRVKVMPTVTTAARLRLGL